MNEEHEPKTRRVFEYSPNPGWHEVDPKTGEFLREMPAELVEGTIVDFVRETINRNKHVPANRDHLARADGD